jgi:hypothetical protein
MIYLLSSLFGTIHFFFSSYPLFWQTGTPSDVFEKQKTTKLDTKPQKMLAKRLNVSKYFVHKIWIWNRSMRVHISEISGGMGKQFGYAG